LGHCQDASTRTTAFKFASTDPPTLALDNHGDVIGGVRTTDVEVPSSTLTGTPQPGASQICSIVGSTVPFAPVELASLYGSKANYLSKDTADLDRAISERYLLPAERTELLAKAEAVQFPLS
jgi:Alpha/beta hydrolase domain